MADLELMKHGENFGSYKQFKSRQTVHSQKEETAAYLRFSSDIKTKRETGLLIILRDDPSTIPSFHVKYPKKDIDGKYVVITSWTEKVL